jgi:ribosomal protein S18 acetylase RimI-like enzyme
MQIVRAIEQNFFAIGRYWATLNSEIFQSKSISATSTGIPVADLNWAWNEMPLEPQDAENISNIKVFYKQLNLPFWWWVYPSGQGSRNLNIFESNGLRYLTEIPCLAIDLSLIPSSIPSKSETRVELVQSLTDLALWETLSFAGFEFAANSSTSYHRFVTAFDINEQSPQKLFLAYLDGLPVASSMLFIKKDTAGIYFVSTLPAYRGRGMGLALTDYMMLYAKKLGLNLCVLQASELGFNVYMRAGFSKYCDAYIYSVNH